MTSFFRISHACSMIIRSGHLGGSCKVSILSVPSRSSKDKFFFYRLCEKGWRPLLAVIFSIFLKANLMTLLSKENPSKMQNFNAFLENLLILLESFLLEFILWRKTIVFYYVVLLLLEAWISFAVSSKKEFRMVTHL